MTAGAAGTSAAPAGLTSDEAARRLAADGPNRLPEAPPPSRLALAAAQFRNGMVVLLAGAAAVALAFGQGEEAALIVAIVLANAVLGYAQERRAHAATAALRDLVRGHARVVRDGRTVTVAAEDVVAGDVVVLEAGDRVPADLRLDRAHGLAVDESTLTGESAPAAKLAGAPDGAALAERPGRAFAGTVAVSGTARGTVTATGPRTAVGEVVASVPAAPPRTPLQIRLDRLAGLLLRASIACGAVLGLLAWAGGETPEDALLVAVALAVAVVPEGLPAVVTVTLALGMRRMARHGAVVRRLHAVETLGSTTVVCSDKTGTLTQNRMTVTGCDGGDEDAVLRTAVLASDSGAASPEEAAIARAAARRGIDRRALLGGAEVVAVEPFDAATRRMAVTVAWPDGAREVYVKGAPEAVAVDPAMTALAEDWAAAGNRVLLAAHGPAPDALGADGLVLLADPARPEAAASLAAARGAGVRTLMITGDHPRTARAIAADLGLLSAARGDVLTGAELDALDDAALTTRLATADVLARVEPRHKLRVVRALQDDGEVVAMTGDGVNDVPALAAAHIGVAMGRRGTDAAIEAADMVLTDDDYATIVRAIAGGRAIHDDIARFVHFLLATNAGAMLLFAIAIPLGLGAPMTVAQILMVNLLTDGLPAVALGLDPPAPDVMRRPPRPLTEGLLDPLRARLGIAGLTTGLVTFAALLVGHADSLATGRTMAFATFVAAKLLYVFSVRGDGPPWRAGPNPLLYAAVALSALLALAVVAVPAARGPFETVALGGTQTVIVAALAVVPVLCAELYKLWARRP